MTAGPPLQPRVRLWMKLAAFAAAGVVLMHALHLAIGSRISGRALIAEQELLGRTIARLVAREAADPLLLDDIVTLHEVVSRTAAPGSGIAYCFILREGAVVVSSFNGPTPPALVRLRSADDNDPVLLRNGASSTLDLREPILDAKLGEVRVGVDLAELQVTRRQLASQLGLLAVAVIALGFLAALLLGRSLARPVGQILAAADRFDPNSADAVPTVEPTGSDEIAVLVDRFNRMMARLRAASVEQARALQKSMEAERLVALGSLVAGVAHEVNNPLAGLKNCLRRLERDDLPQPKRREYLSLMDESLDRIAEVVRRLLDFGRPHQRRPQPLDTADLAQAGARMIHPLLQKRRIRCEVALDGQAGPVLADRHQLEQALMNLLLNAAWVTPDGGVVTLRLRSRSGKRGLAVEDRGPGIPVQLRDRVLDPFFTTKPPGEGTGLGLTVTRSLVDAHGGDLDFEFPEQGGTVVTIWLPEFLPEVQQSPGAMPT